MKVTQYHTLRWTNMALGFVPSPYLRPGSMVFYYCAIASLILITLLAGWPLVGKVREVSSPSNHHEKRDSFPEHPFFSGKFQRLRHHFNSIPPSSSVLGSKLVMLGMVIPPLMTGIQKNGYMKFETLLGLISLSPTIGEIIYSSMISMITIHGLLPNVFGIITIFQRLRHHFSTSSIII